MSKELKLSSTVIKTDNFVSSELDDGMVMMSIENNSYYGLDEIGKIVLELSSEPVKVSLIIENLLKEYDIDQNQCKKDTIELLIDLQKEGIIEVV